MIKESSIEINFKSSVEEVWEVITNRKDTSWRYDIDNVEILNEKEFKETTKAGLVTNYEIIENKENSYYKLKMKNKDIEGIFEAKFETKNGVGCVVNIYQKNEMLSLSSKIAATIFVNLQKLQNRYAYDIKRKLKEL